MALAPRLKKVNKIDIQQVLDRMYKKLQSALAVIFAGDLTGDATSQTVVGIQGRSVASDPPGDGDMYTWNNLSSQWEPTPLAFSGDLTGDSSSQTVVGIQTRTVSAAAPADRDVLIWDDFASQWVPGDLPFAVVDTVAELAAYDTSGLENSVTFWVRSVRDEWILEKDTTQPFFPDNITICNATPTGKWRRRLLPNPYWTYQFSSPRDWYIDIVNGDDENDGTTFGTALETWAEFRRRAQQSFLPIQSATVYIGERGLFSSDQIEGQFNLDEQADLNITGLPELVDQGTVQNFTRNPAAGDEGTLTATAAQFWGYGYFFRFTSGPLTGYTFYLHASLGGNSYACSRILRYFSGATYIPAGVNPNPGDTFDVFEQPACYLGALAISAPAARTTNDLNFIFRSVSLNSSIAVPIVTGNAAYVDTTLLAEFEAGGNSWMINVYVSGFFYASGYFKFSGGVLELNNGSVFYTRSIANFADDPVQNWNGLEVQDGALVNIEDWYVIRNIYNARGWTVGGKMKFDGGSLSGVIGTGSAIMLRPGAQVYLDRDFQWPLTITVPTPGQEIQILGGTAEYRSWTEIPWNDSHRMIVVSDAVEGKSTTLTGGYTYETIKVGYLGAGPVAPNLTQFLLPNFTLSLTDILEHTVQNNTTLRKLRVRAAVAPVGENNTFEVLVNGAPLVPAWILTLNAGAFTAQDTTSNYQVLAGDTVSVRATSPGAGTSAADVVCELEAA